MTPLRLAVIGCGYATRTLHLPALARVPELRLVGLVDPDEDAARELAAAYGAEWVARDHRHAIGRADAVLLAAPNHLHAPLAVDLLEAGVHVLVEKPMAVSVADCDRMIAAAEEYRRVLAVGLMRRFYEWTAVVSRLIAARPLGDVRRLELTEGERYRLPVRTAFRFDPARAGGGVLADRGIHLLDLLGCWLGEPIDLEYRDDAEGGVEAECLLRAAYAGGVSAEVLLTRLRTVPNVHRIEFDRGTLVLEDPGSPAPRALLAAGGSEWSPVAAPGAPAEAWIEVFRRQLADFAGAIRYGRDPAVPGRDGRRSVELLQRCYALRRALPRPWEEAA